MEDSFIHFSFRPACNGKKEHILITQENSNSVLTLSMDNFASMMFMLRAVERHLVYVQEDLPKPEQLVKTINETANDSTGMQFTSRSPEFMRSADNQ